MAAIEIREDKTSDWKRIGDVAPGDMGGKLTPEELASNIRFRHGSAEGPMLFELDLVPNAATNVHAHAEYEIFYVVSGMIKVGRRSFGPGTSISIPGLRLYSFQAGPDGARVLNFRPRFDESFFMPEELALAKRH